MILAEHFLQIDPTFSSQQYPWFKGLMYFMDEKQVV